ncbi:hypothetical protein [Streptomyces sp. YIM 98790]|uniref:hypothetical protein n=1 Tax=Streptomyces sp. YIM 98790 TaxID=2689077 RepID=UPI00140C345F|nr:hypothetical protein [Streptomyces sp. YIM 98790]
MDGAGAVVVRVAAGPDHDAAELASLARGLRRELLELDVAAVEPVTAADLPEGAKGLGTMAGALLVRMGVTAGLRKVVEAVRRWAARDAVRSVEIAFGDDVLKVTGVSPERQEQLIEVWLARHGSGS